MVYNLVAGIVYLILFVFLMTAFGKKITHKNFSISLVSGYVVYICLCSLGGMIAQFFTLPWLYYKGFMIALLLAIAFYSCYHIDFKQYFDVSWMKAHLKQHIVYYIMSFVFVVLGLLYIYYQWSNNLIDDAWYLGKIHMVPRVDNMTTLYYPTGFHYPADYVRMVNTFEIELAFMSDVTGISASFFVKVIQSYFIYFLILQLFHILYTILLKAYKVKGTYTIPCMMLVCLLFGWYFELLAGKEVLYMHDSWQFNTAIWFGSSTVRTMALMLLLVPFISEYKLTIKKFIGFIITCIFLLSRASQAIPAIYLAVACYICYTLFMLAKKKSYVYGIILAIFIGMALIPRGVDLQPLKDVVYMIIKNNITSIALASCFLLLLLSFEYRAKQINRWNCFLLIMGVLIFIPRINTLFLKFCIYDFVVARTITLYLFTLIATSGCYLGYAMYRFLKSPKKVMLFYSLLSVYLIAVPLSYIQQIFGLKHAVGVLMRNQELLPESTLRLSEHLSQYQTSLQTSLYVLAPAWVSLDGTVHALASMIRYEAPNIYSIGSIPRYSGMNEDNPYNGYTQTEQDVFEKFNDGSDMDVKKLRALLKKYPANCLVFTNENAKALAISALGFHEAFTLQSARGDLTYYVVTNADK